MLWVYAVCMSIRLVLAFFVSLFSQHSWENSIENVRKHSLFSSLREFVYILHSAIYRHRCVFCMSIAKFWCSYSIYISLFLFRSFCGSCYRFVFLCCLSDCAFRTLCLTFFYELWFMNIDVLVNILEFQYEICIPLDVHHTNNIRLIIRYGYEAILVG